MINIGRHSPIPQQDTVVFLIGMRLNSIMALPRFFKIGSQMVKMQREQATEDHGCLATYNWVGRTTLALQYWRDFESLENYAHALTHMQAWRDYTSDGKVGIWHETYEIKAREAVYVNMPKFGLGGAIGLEGAKGAMKTARKRLEASSK